MNELKSLQDCTDTLLKMAGRISDCRASGKETPSHLVRTIKMYSSVMKERFHDVEGLSESIDQIIGIK